MDEFFKNIFAVLVLYNEQLDKTNTFLSLKKAIPQGFKLNLFIYDNSPVRQNVANIDSKKFNLDYHHDQSNSGVSKAYNFGAEIASNNGQEWLLILDQDTTFSKNLFIEYFDSVQNNIDISLFAPVLRMKDGAVLSPCKFTYYGRHLSNIDSGIESFSNSSPVNSGILVRTQAFNKAGGYNEDVPLDLSDHQFIKRFKQANKYYFIINSEGIQNFSAIEDNLDKQINRFKYYCLGTYNFETQSSFTKFMMVFFLILKMLKKTVTYKSIHFFKILLLTKFSKP